MYGCTYEYVSVGGQKTPVSERDIEKRRQLNLYPPPEGREKIAFNRLRDDACSTNMIASCCKALLCVEHPGYVGQSVLLFPDFCSILGVPPLLPPACRIFIKDAL